MAQKGLSGFFEKYLDENLIFRDKKALQSTYTPETILHRDKEINQIASILAPSLREEKPSNLFIYGTTGTGKTLCIKHISSQMKQLAEKRGILLNIIYLNCKMKRIADTEYRLIAQLIKELGYSVPPTGLPTDEVYNSFYRIIEKGKEKLLVLVLDEIDQLIKKAGDEIIYNLTRINSSEQTKTQISLVGISNNLVFTNTMDPRARSSLCEEDVVFTQYNASQLQDILRKRAEQAFKPGVLEQGLIEKCAAYAAREHGDARRALELLRVAGEVAERKSLSKVRIDHLDEAEEKIEKEKVLEIAKTLPKQSQVALFSIILLFDKEDKTVFTGDIYEIYKQLCMKSDLRPLTQRRISDIIGELDMLGIINATIVYKGRYGRTREIKPEMSPTLKQKIKAILIEELNLG
jgi:cell division control protein 6